MLIKLTKKALDFVDSMKIGSELALNESSLSGFKEEWGIEDNNVFLDALNEFIDNISDIGKLKGNYIVYVKENDSLKKVSELDKSLFDLLVNDEAVLSICSNCGVILGDNRSNIGGVDYCKDCANKVAEGLFKERAKYFELL